MARRLPATAKIDGHNPGMDLGVELGIAVAAAVGIATVAATRRWGSRRGALTVDVRTVRLRPVAIKVGDTIEIAKMNPPMQFAVQCRLRNVGRDDIDEADFKQRPLRFSVGTKSIVVGLAVSDMPIVEMVRDQTRVEILPRRIPAGANWRWTLHVIGETPYVLVSSPIRNTPVKFKDHKATTGPATLTIGTDYGFKGGKWIRERVTYL